MTAELAPNGTGRATRARRLSAKDAARLAEYDRLRSLGDGELDAWRKVITGAFPMPFVRRGEPVTDERVRANLAQFTAFVMGERVESGRRALSQTIPDAVSAIGDIIRGDFGEGKVRVRQDGTEDVTIDAAAAGVRSQNARWLLERTGVVAPANASGVTVNGPAQFNFASAAKTRAASG